MERHKCKLCMRSFANGRALGGHMRSHMMNLPIVPKPDKYEEQVQLVDELDLSASSSSEDEDEEETRDGDEEEEDDEEGMLYGLRENPKRSIKLVDPEFSFAVDAGSVVLQDRESETESSKNPTRRRSKRTRKSVMLDLPHHQYQEKLEALKKIKLKEKLVISSKTDSFEPEPVSSISDATTEEDVAFCLMMLSRDKWRKQEQQEQQEQQQNYRRQRPYEQEQEEDQDDETERSLEDTDESEEQMIMMSKFPRARTRLGKYKCETCNKVFKSYQALGGHRASHKKIKALNPTPTPNLNPKPIYKPELELENNAGTSSVAEKKIHECPVCFRVFSSGQALGGHKRSHVTGATAAASSTPVRNVSKLGENLIDLNLPAPVEDDEISQIELSAVSDAEFVNPVTR